MAGTAHCENLQLTESDVLSPREREATLLVAAGLTAKEMAVSMGCTVRTANAHVENSMNKLGAINRAHLVARAFEQGVVVFNQIGRASIWFLCTLMVATALWFAVFANDSQMVRRSRRGSYNVRIVRQIPGRKTE